MENERKCQFNLLSGWWWTPDIWKCHRTDRFNSNSNSYQTWRPLLCQFGKPLTNSVSNEYKKGNFPLKPYDILMEYTLGKVSDRIEHHHKNLHKQINYFYICHNLKVNWESCAWNKFCMSRMNSIKKHWSINVYLIGFVHHI